MKRGAPTLQRGSPLPLYYQIANNIRSRIDAREWVASEQLPSEETLASTFNVSPLTVRQALGLLSTQGTVRREQGRGTFVTEQAEGLGNKVRLTVPLEQITAGIEDLPVRVIDKQEVQSPRSVLELLGIPRGEGAIRIRRLRLHGRTPITYAIAYVPKSLGGRLTTAELRSPLLIKVLERKRGVFFSEVDQTIEASVADDETAGHLAVMVGSPVLVVHRTYAFADHRVGYVAVNRYPSHLFRYELRLERFARRDAAWRIVDPTQGKRKEDRKRRGPRRA